VIKWNLREGFEIEPGPVGLKGDGYSANERWWKASGLEVFVISSTLCNGLRTVYCQCQLASVTFLRHCALIDTSDIVHFPKRGIAKELPVCLKLRLSVTSEIIVCSVTSALSFWVDSYVHYRVPRN
jgi:hypothetical protein